MDQMRKFIAESTGFRVAVVLAIGAVLALPFIPEPWLRSIQSISLQSISLQAARYAGPYIILVLFAAALGWIAYSRRVFLWTAAVLVGGFGAIHLFGMYAQSELAARDSKTPEIASQECNGITTVYRMGKRVC